MTGLSAESYDGGAVDVRGETLVIRDQRLARSVQVCGSFAVASLGAIRRTPGV